MKKHHYVVADKPRFILFCVSVLICCVVTGYLAGTVAASRIPSARQTITYYSPMHFANHRD